MTDKITTSNIQLLKLYALDCAFFVGSGIFSHAPTTSILTGICNATAVAAANHFIKPDENTPLKIKSLIVTGALVVTAIPVAVVFGPEVALQLGILHLVTKVTTTCMAAQFSPSKDQKVMEIKEGEGNQRGANTGIKKSSPFTMPKEANEIVDPLALFEHLTTDQDKVDWQNMTPEFQLYCLDLFLAKEFDIRLFGLETLKKIAEQIETMEAYKTLSGLTCGPLKTKCFYEILRLRTKPLPDDKEKSRILVDIFCYENLPPL